MALKYDFNITQGNNLFIDAIVYANNNSSGLFVYASVLMICLTALYVFNRFQDDFTLSLLYTLYIGVVLGIIYYYMGLYLGEVLFSGFILITLILIVSGMTAFLYYGRNKLGGD